MQRACLAPSLFSSVPTNSPARVSGSPKKDSAPYFCQSRSPALMATTGMPASTRLLHDRAERGGVGQGDGDAVDLAVDGVLDERRLFGDLAGAGVPELDVVLVRRLLGARLDL